MSKSRRSGSSFGTGKTQNRKSRGELIRERYSTDRYPTTEDFIRAVEQDPDHFDPSHEYFFPHDYGNKFSSNDGPGGRGFSGTNLKTNRPNRSNWIADNPIGVEVDVDPGSLSLSKEVWNDGENSIDVVAGVDVVPLGVDINVNGDVGSIGVELGAPGDLFGVGAEISFDTDTGEVIGGGANIELGGLDIGVNRTSHKGKTCTSITVTYFGVGATYQNCQKEEEDDEDDEKPSEDEGFPPLREPPPVVLEGMVCPLRKSKGSYTETYVQYMGGSGTGASPTVSDYSVSHNESMYPVLAWYDWIKSIPDPPPMDEKKNQSVISNTKTNAETVNFLEVWCRLGWYDDKKKQSINELIQISFEHRRTSNTVGYVHPTFSECVSPTDWSYPAKNQGYIDYHTMRVVRKRKFTQLEFRFYPGMWNSQCEYIDTPEPPIFPPPPPPPIPPEDTMPDKCCNLEPVMSMLRKLNQALAVDEVVDQGLELPNEWILPTGKGHTKMNNYLEIAVFLAKMQDHLGVHPLTVQIADLSAGQDGNQQFKKFYPNGTKAIQEILTILHDENSDSSDRLNLQMRLAVLNTRIFLTVASISRSLRGVFQFLGIPIREKREAVPLPFDFAFGLRKNKGFSNDAKKDGEELERNMKQLATELNKNTENATEALLDKFLADSDQPIGYETFDPNLPDLLDRLKQILDKK